MRLKLVLDDLIKSGKYKSKGGINPYRNFLKLILKLATGKNSSQLRKELGIKKGKSILNNLSQDDLRKVTILDNQIALLLENGNLNYQDIKNMNLIVY